MEDENEEKSQKLAHGIHVLIFLGLSMDPLLLNDCHISIFSGLGGHGLSFFSVGQ